mmetsp:Transcript_46786/g.52318  ORF Transcript_46786/g.52318 Transcript_46786/m.52318 type:complete len:86 (+) Transcript_46786:94-351(+)
MHTSAVSNRSGNSKRASSSISSSTQKDKSVKLWGYTYVCVGLTLLIGPISGIDWDRPQLRILTYLPVALVICICHWVSLRIYLRR